MSLGIMDFLHIKFTFCPPKCSLKKKFTLPMRPQEQITLDFINCFGLYNKIYFKKYYLFLSEWTSN